MSSEVLARVFHEQDVKALARVLLMPIGPKNYLSVFSSRFQRDSEPDLLFLPSGRDLICLIEYFFENRCFRA
jgi:hypothetical protein